MITLMITTLWDSILSLCPSNFMSVVLKDEVSLHCSGWPHTFGLYIILYSQSQKYLDLQPWSTAPSYSHAIGEDAGVP